jgi:phospholipase/carboxylesterase
VDDLETFEVIAGGGVQDAAPVASVIWMHGLGADAHDFESVPPMLDLGPALPVRYIFPNAPVRPVTLNGGMRMRAWYDLLGLDRDAPEDAEGIRESGASIAGLIEREVERGISADNIVLAGFSQGGAIALYTALRYPSRLAGVLALSCYLPLSAEVETERHSANAKVPIFMAHGEFDDVVAVNFARGSRKRLHTMGYDVDWREYPMAHSVMPEEIGDIKKFLATVLKPIPA